MGASSSSPKPPPTLGPAAPAPPEPPTLGPAAPAPPEPSKKRQPKAPPTPRPLKRPRRSCRGPAPIPETPVAVLVAGGATAVVRERAHQLTLQGAHRCFGQVRAVTGTPADRAPGETATPKFGTEVRLGLHEMCYLAARDRVIIRETSDGDALDGAEIRRRCGAWAPLGDVRFDATLAVYAHFRDKKWIVKDGLQFGADFVLYRRSPDVFHAEYCVVVAERDEVVPWRPGQEKSASSSLHHECSRARAFRKSIHASRPFREMIARPKISRNEWKTTEIGAFEVGNFAPFSCPGGGAARRTRGSRPTCASTSASPTRRRRARRSPSSRSSSTTPSRGPRTRTPASGARRCPRPRTRTRSGRGTTTGGRKRLLRVRRQKKQD
jgi:tRNA-splicing endonuclease subunit Sen2